MSEFLRRLVVAMIVGLAFAMAGAWSWAVVAGLGVLAITIYRYFPRETPPPNALRYDAGPSQTGPDWLGFVLSGLFFAIPIWAARAEPAFGAIHPAALLTWPLALLSVAFWMIGAVYAPYWIVIERDGLRVRSAFTERVVPFADVLRVYPYRRAIPRWLTALAPMLAGSGNFGTAGALMLARPRKGIVIEHRGGQHIAIASDSFEKPMEQIMAALKANGLSVDPPRKGA
ncbi:hypothetical protein [Sinisalibacter lacisalsi]|nr:hypothetical protein [Sinisalibacter lacisalsi]